MSDRIQLALFAAYLICIPLTWGFLWNRLPECGVTTDSMTVAESREIVGCQGGNAFGLLGGSLFWPVYWVGHIAIEVTK